MLLQHKDILPLALQRVAAMFLLYELYRSDQPSANPFAQFFVELLQPQVEDDRVVNGVSYGHTLSAVEKWFLAQLLNSTPKDVRTYHYVHVFVRTHVFICKFLNYMYMYMYVSLYTCTCIYMYVLFWVIYWPLHVHLLLFTAIAIFSNGNGWHIKIFSL